MDSGWVVGHAGSKSPLSQGARRTSAALLGSGHDAACAVDLARPYPGDESMAFGDDPQSHALPCTDVGAQKRCAGMTERWVVAFSSAGALDSVDTPASRQALKDVRAARTSIGAALSMLDAAAFAGRQFRRIAARRRAESEP